MNRKYDKGAYSYRISEKHSLKFEWDEEIDCIAIYFQYSSGAISIFAERSYKKSAIAEMRTVFEYLVDYYRYYRER